MKFFSKSILPIHVALAIGANASASIVKGTLVDMETLEGEPYATVRFFNAPRSGQEMYTVVTDADGNFAREIDRPGEYIVVFSSLGKGESSRHINVRDNIDIDLDTIGLTPDTRMMDEVVVVARRPLVRMEADKLAYDVTGDSQAKSVTLLDILRKVPMVTVDGEDNVTVNGSSDFKVYVDGKPSMLFSGNPGRIFKSMPASSVRSIEVVTNLGARYDAEGAGGVLNLVLDGENGNVERSDLYSVSASIRGGNTGGGASVYGNGKSGRFSLGLTAMYNDARPGTSTIMSQRVQQDEIVESRSQGKPSMPFAMGNVSLGYEVDSLTSFGVSLAVNSFRMHSSGITSTDVKGGMGDIGYVNDATVRMNRIGFNGSIDFSRHFGAGRRNHLTAAYQMQHDHSRDKTTSDFSGDGLGIVDLTDRISDNVGNTTMHIVMTDFSSRLDARNVVSAGAKLSLRNARADAGYYLKDVLDPERSTSYDNDNVIAAAYGEYSFSSGGVLAKGGVRYEYTWQSVRYHEGSGSDFSTRYGILVPSVSLSYKFSGSGNIGLNYNMRISRPGLSYLNPYVDRSNPTSLTYGNPDLDVERNHYVGLTFNLFVPKLMMSVTLSDSYTGNGIEQYSFMDDNLLNTTYGNIVKRNRVGLNAYVSWTPLTGTSVMFNGSVNHTGFRSHRPGLDNGGWQGSVTLGLQQRLPLDIKAGAFLMASTRSYTPQGWNGGYKMLSLNLTKSVANDRLNLSLGFTTGLSKGGKMKIESYTSSAQFTNHNCISIPMVGFNVGVTYNFGTSDQVKVMERNSIKSDFIEQKSDMEQYSSPSADNSVNAPASF